MLDARCNAGKPLLSNPVKANNLTAFVPDAT
jgi:hypothetical protein